MMFNIFNLTVSVKKMSNDKLCSMEMESSRVKNEYESLKDKYLYQSSMMFIMK